MKNLIYKWLMLFTITGLVFSCDDEDYTGDSDLSPTDPTISIAFDPAESTLSFLEQDSTITFTVTLSTTQIVDVAVYVTMVDGTATPGEDFTFTDRLVIPAHRTSASGEIKISTDELTEGTETFTIQVGDERTANASITPQTISFELMNESSDALVATLSWSTDAESVLGVALSPTAAVDMRFLIVDAADNTLIDAIDGAAFESYEEFNTLPDGEYLLGIDIFSTVDAGDLNEPLTLSFQLDFFQAGVIDGVSLSFPDVRTNENACSAVRNYLATVTKVGDTYTFEESVSTAPVDASILLGAYTGIDGTMHGLGYTSPGAVTIALDGTDLTIDGLNQDFILNIWGEEVQTQVPVVFTYDPYTFEIDIPQQYIFTTLYSGSLYDYDIVGSGILDVCSETITLDYEMIQDGFEVGAWLNTNGYSDDPIFRAVLSK